MDFIKEILLKGLHGLPATSIKMYLIQLLLCGLLAVIVSFLYKKKAKRKISFPVVSVSLSLGIIVPFVQYSTPLAIISLGLMMLLVSKHSLKESERPFLFLLLFTVLGLAAGYLVFALIGFCIGLIYLLLAATPIEDSK